MTPERLAETRRHDAAHNPGDVRSDALKDAIKNLPETHRRELLAEVDRLEVAADRKNRLLVRLEEQRDEQRARADRLAKELADLRPYAEAGKRLAAKQAESEYYHGTCDDCSCCTTAQCREGRCPENSIGDSICPCTCD